MRWAEAAASVARVRPLCRDGAQIRAELLASGAIRERQTEQAPTRPCAYPIDDRTVIEAARTILGTQPYERLRAIAEQADPRVAARLRSVLAQHGELLAEAA